MENVDRVPHEITPMDLTVDSHTSTISRRILRKRTPWSQYLSDSLEKMKGSIWIPFKVETVEGERQNDVNSTYRKSPSLVETHDESAICQFQQLPILCSETYIISKCRKLNLAIFETAVALFAEWSGTPQRRQDLAQIPLDAADQNILQYFLGTDLFRSIRCATKDETLIRTICALQAAAVEICFQIISQTFCPFLCPTEDRQMQDAFQVMLSKAPLDPQATAILWRALTYTLLYRDDVHGSFIAASSKKMEHYFSSVLILAGGEYSSTFPSIIHGVISEYQIIEIAFALSDALKMGHLSVHLDVCRVQPGQTFRKDTMDLVGGVSGETHVLCTTDLGFCEIVSNDNARLSQGRTLLKPKVVLKATTPIWARVAISAWDASCNAVDP